MPTGKGYQLCQSICHQAAHAEIVALEKAGDAARGAVLWLEGHSYACEPCKAACDAAGIVKIRLSAPTFTKTARVASQ